MGQLHLEVSRLLRSLLGVLDNLELALDASNADSEEALAEGVRGIHRQLVDLLYRYDVRSFASEAARFDPARHEAMGQLRSTTVAPGHVVKEIRRGYLMGETLFRAAQVMVAAEPTAEHAPVVAAGLTAPKGSRAAERSAPSRPSWLLNPPHAADMRYQVGRVSAAESAEVGQARAREEALIELLQQLPDLVDNEALAEVYRELILNVRDRPLEGIWARLVSHVPTAEDWVDDFYWEQVKSEVRGRAFDVAVLLAVPIAEATTLASVSQDVERWGGLELIDLGPLWRALGDDLHGALLVATHRGGLGTRAGFRTGDIITRIGLRTVDGASNARRLLGQAGKGRRVFEVELIRELGEPQLLRVEPAVMR